MEGILERLTAFVGVKPREVKEEKTGDELIPRIRALGKEIEAVRSRFDLETDFDLIDATIMELDSLEKRYNYLLKEAKRKGIAAGYEELLLCHDIGVCRSGLDRR